MIRFPVLVAAFLVFTACERVEDSGEKPFPPADTLTTEQHRVIQAVREVDAMRSALAQTLITDDEVDERTFAAVCRPVGARAKEIADENGWAFQQLAVQYRNPGNAPDSVARGAFDRFESDPSLDSLWIRTSVDGKQGRRYFRRITVEAPCLACHGPKSERPQFIVDNYPEDLAFGFETGDLRGLYSVWVPGVE